MAPPRIEKDSLGEKEIPATANYGIHTARSLENFQISGKRVPLEIIYAIVTLKRACARANVKLRLLDPEKGKAIERAGKLILSGHYDEEFPLDVFQSGSGTSSNMNVNEVIATIAADMIKKSKEEKAIHPNDDVNKGQSTNNVFPSAIKIAAYRKSTSLIKTLHTLIKALRKKEREFSPILKSGRTHLQDAVPITLGQEFGAYARALEKATTRIEESRKNLLELGIGGNAVGTGLNTKPEFRKKILTELKKITKITFILPQDGIEITQFQTDLAQFSASLTLLSSDLLKIVNDFILLSSGPNTGFNEITLPAVEPGSSIMPGKINPSICEAVRMVCISVHGRNHAVQIAATHGQLELNAHLPLIGAHIVQALTTLTNSCTTLAEKCIAGITANEDVCRNNFENSAGLATVLNPKLGYDRVAQLVKESLRTKKPLKKIIIEKKIMNTQEFETLIKNATKPNL